MKKKTARACPGLPGPGPGLCGGHRGLCGGHTGPCVATTQAPVRLRHSTLWDSHSADVRDAGAGGFAQKSAATGVYPPPLQDCYPALRGTSWPLSRPPGPRAHGVSSGVPWAPLGPPGAPGEGALYGVIITLAGWAWYGVIIELVVWPGLLLRLHGLLLRLPRLLLRLPGGGHPRDTGGPAVGHIGAGTQGILEAQLSGI